MQVGPVLARFPMQLVLSLLDRRDALAKRTDSTANRRLFLRSRNPGGPESGLLRPPEGRQALEEIERISSFNFDAQPIRIKSDGQERASIRLCPLPRWKSDENNRTAKPSDVEDDST